MEQSSFFYAMDHDFIPLPEGVMPWGATYSPDGKYILFHDYNGGREWMVRSDGTGLKCITGEMEGRPDFLGGFYYLLDDKRMFLSNELGDTAVILECEPSVYDWERYRFMPIDLSGDGELGRLCLGRRTYHMAPDGRHLAYNILTPVGLVMTLCTLERQEDRYAAKEFYCLNPQGPLSSEDGEQSHWCHGGTLTEFKAFCDGGRGILFVMLGDGGNTDQYRLDLETGDITRLTYDLEWDEDGAVSPDGTLDVCASWRHMGQIDVLNQVPCSLPVNGFYLGAVIALYYVSSFPGFANDLQPWLNDQPLAPYEGGDCLTANNLSGHPMWHPDSTRVLLQERSLMPPPEDINERILEKGMAPNRLHIVRLRKAPTEPLPVAETRVGSWARRLCAYKANADFPGTHTLLGKTSGVVKLDIEGNLLGCRNRVAYENFSNDGVYFTQGVEEVWGNTGDLCWKQQLVVRDQDGNVVGQTDMDLRFRKKTPAPPRNIPPMELMGRASSTWKGVTKVGLPGFGPKTATLPKASPLILRTQRVGAELEVYVSADVYGETRPVFGARVTFCGEQRSTDTRGRAVFLAQTGTIQGEAGSNFIPSTMDIYI